MDNNNSYFEIPLKKDNKIIAKQKIFVGDNNSFYFQQQGQKDSIIGIDAYNNKIIFSNEDKKFSSIATSENVSDEIIMIDIKNLKIEYNQDITFVAEENGQKFTYKITPYAVQRKAQSEKEFKNILQFKTPLDISLPNDLPNQISNGVVEMKEFPTQMASLLESNYGYSTFTSKNGNLKLLKSPNNEVLVNRGSKFVKTNGFEYFKNGQESILGIKLESSKGIVQGKSTLGIGFNISEKELKDASTFIEGKKLSNEQFKDRNNIDASIDYKKAQNLKETSKNIKEVINTNMENIEQKIDEENKNENQDINQTKQNIADQNVSDSQQEQEKKDTNNDSTDGSSSSNMETTNNEQQNVSENSSTTNDDKPQGDSDNNSNQQPANEVPPKAEEKNNVENKENKPTEKNEAENKADAEKNKKLAEKRASKHKKRVKLFIKIFTGLALLFLSGGAMLVSGGLMLSPLLLFLGLFTTFFALGLSTYAQTEMFQKYSGQKGFFGNLKDNIKSLQKDKVKDNTKTNEKERAKVAKMAEEIEYKRKNGLTRKQSNKYYNLLNKQKNGKELSKREQAKFDKLSAIKENKLNDKEQAKYDKLLEKSIQEPKLSDKQEKKLQELLLKQEDNALTNKEKETLQNLQSNLSKRERKELADLQYKKENGITLKDQEILNMNSQNISKTDIKSLNELTTKVENFETLTKDEKIDLSSYTQSIADGYDKQFEADRKNYLHNTKVQIMEREKIIEENSNLVKNNQKPFLSQEKIDILNNEITSLRQYGKQVASLENPNFEVNNQIIDHIAADDITKYTHKDLQNKQFIEYKNEKLPSPKSFLSETLKEAKKLQNQNLINQQTNQQNNNENSVTKQKQ